MIKTTALRSNHASPLYEQLKQAILREIMSETYKLGDRLPSEAELSDKYGVSRITVRRTIAELVEGGYLSAQQGRGTFVKYSRNPQELRSFYNFNDGNIHHLDRKVLTKEYVEADKNLSDVLDVPLGTRMVKLHRLLSEGGKKYSLDTAYFLDELYPGIFPLLQDNISTLDLLAKKYRMKFYRAYKVLGVIQAGDYEASLLGCVSGEPLFSITKVLYDLVDKPVHYSHYMLLGSRCKYTLEVTNDEADTRVLFQDNDVS
jgi:DNA-binding GntR family transcriptional regulator